MWPEVLHDLDCVLSTPEKFCKVFFTFHLSLAWHLQIQHLSKDYGERLERATYCFAREVRSADPRSWHHPAGFSVNPHGELQQARLPLLRGG
jgi:hypothetical protein